jgi:hypothetical protein
MNSEHIAELRLPAEQQAEQACLSPESLGWYWRNCRSIGFGLQVWPLDWAIGYERSGDCWGMEWRLHVGPVLFTMYANIGNADRRFWPGLDEDTAHKRAEAYWKADHS